MYGAEKEGKEKNLFVSFVLEEQQLWDLEICFDSLASRLSIVCIISSLTFKVMGCRVEWAYMARAKILECSSDSL